MGSSVVPQPIQIATDDLSTWQRVGITGDTLNVQGSPVRILHDVYVLGWQLLEHDDCRQHRCLAEYVLNGHCCHKSIEPPDPFWLPDECRHVYAVEIAAAVRTAAGTFDRLVARGGTVAVHEILRPFFGDDDPADCVVTLSALAGELIIKHDGLSPSSSVARLRRNLVLPQGWERHAERTFVPFEGVRAMLEARDGFDPSVNDDGGSLEPRLCTECGELLEDGWCGPQSWCRGCSWP